MSVERVAEMLSSRHFVFHCYFDSLEFDKKSKSPMSFAEQALLMLYNHESVMRFKGQVAACRPDIILVHNLFPVGSIGVYHAILTSGIPVFHYIHNFRPFSVNGYLWGKNRMITNGLHKNFIPEIMAASWQGSRLKTAWYACVIRLMHAMGIYRRVTSWLAISHFMKKTFVGAGIPEEKIFVLPHAWIIGQKPLQDETPVGDTGADEPYILFMGRLTEAKGLRVLMAAWKKVEEVNSTGRLVIAGEGPLSDWVAEQQKNLKRVNLCGFISGVKKDQLLRRCRSMVVPSVWWEPLGLVVYEAYQFGRPVIAAKSGGLAETVQNGQTGWLYEPNDDEALKECILAALDTGDEADRRGLTGWSWLKENTSPEQWIKSFEAIAANVIRMDREKPSKRRHGHFPNLTRLETLKDQQADVRKLTFSIITPSFRQVEHLKLCALSVADQTGNVTVEHLVHDGLSGSAFDRWAASQDSANCISEKDNGMYDAINRGFARSKGDILAWLNCDEQYLPETLSKVAEYFERHPEADILFGDIVVIAPDGKPIGYRQAVKPMPGHIRTCFLSTFSAATFVRRKVIEQGYLLNTRYRAISDAVWIDGLLRAGFRCMLLNEPLSVFTQTGSNLGQSAMSVEEGLVWRSVTGAHGRLRHAFWTTLHRIRKLHAGAYHTRNASIAIYLEGYQGRVERRGVVSEKWVGNRNATGKRDKVVENNDTCEASKGTYQCQNPTHRSSPNQKSGALRVSVYLGDQNPGFGRSFGISRMSEAVLSALAERNDVDLHLVVSKTSQQGPLRAASRLRLPWGTRSNLLRLFSDHLHPLFGISGQSLDCSYYPKGFLPLLDAGVRPTVVTIHDTIIDYYREHYPSWRRSFEYAYWCWMLKHTLHKADCILTVSECSKRQIEEFMARNSIPQKAITVTYEPCLYQAIPQPENPKKGDYVMHLASKEPHKRTAHLVRWWLESEPAKRPTLQLVGHMPSEVAGFASMSPYLVLRPYLDDAELRALIMGARALILPSEIEGFGLPALEAYYLGTPVCYSKKTSIEEIVKVATNKGGFDMNDPVALFEALDEVLSMAQEEVYQCGLKLRETYADKKVTVRMVSAFGRVKNSGH